MSILTSDFKIATLSPSVQTSYLCPYFEIIAWHLVFLNENQQVKGLKCRSLTTWKNYGHIFSVP